jgi:CheY-like chemotaxis protein
MILYLASDLLWATRIKATAEDLGLPARPVRTLDMLKARLADSPVKALICDLEAPELSLELIRHVKAPAEGEKPAAVRVLCFGPHVAKETLQAARDAGADEVLTRGAFDHHLPEVLMSLAGRSA